MKEVSITVRDGTRIGAAIYAPQANGRYPALLAASPYRYDNNALPAGPQFLWRETGPIDFYVDHGYAYVHMDVRGSGKSGGEFELLGPTEQQDLYDVIQWIAAQPWSDRNAGGSARIRGRRELDMRGPRTPGGATLDLSGGGRREKVALRCRSRFLRGGRAGGDQARAVDASARGGNVYGPADPWPPAGVKYK